MCATTTRGRWDYRYKAGVSSERTAMDIVPVGAGPPYSFPVQITDLSQPRDRRRHHTLERPSVSGWMNKGGSRRLTGSFYGLTLPPSQCMFTGRASEHNLRNGGFMYSSRTTLIVVCAVLLSCPIASAQGTFQNLTITFDGPPVQPPGTSYLIQRYSEADVWFAPIPGTDGFIRSGSNQPPGWPEDGTAYLQASLGDSLRFGLVDGSSFDPVSVDLAEVQRCAAGPRHGSLRGLPAGWQCGEG